MKLYPAQKSIVDQIINAWSLPQTDRCVYLSGEMGCGKTYISVALAKYVIETNHRPLIIICPSIVKDKWKQLLKEVLPNTPINNLSPRKYPTDNTKPEIYLGTTTALKSLAERAKIKQCNLFIDEIQELTPSQIHDYLNTIIRDSAELENKQTPTYQLMITGTIFDNLTEGLVPMLKITNPTMTDYAHVQLGKNMDQIVHDLPAFMQYVWQYISVSLSLDDVKETVDKSQVNQTILPINYLELTPLEHAQYELTLANLNAHSISNAAQIASAFLDDPQQSPLRQIKDKSSIIRNQKASYYLTLPLKPVPLVDTKKYQALVDYLQTVQLKQKVIIYATEPELIEQLTDTLNQNGYHAGTINAKSSKIQQQIENILQKQDILIINPKWVKVGIDINARYIIWYQLLTRMTDILQAQRRITRMSSDTPSEIKYLAYDHTSQRELLENISQANKANAASYGVNDTSNLSKITGLLLPETE